MRGACQKVERRDRKLIKYGTLFHITPLGLEQNCLKLRNLEQLCVKVEINYLQREWDIGLEPTYRMETRSS